MESVLLNRIDDAQILQIDDILQRQPLTSNRRTGEAVFEKKKAANSITRRSGRRRRVPGAKPNSRSSRYSSHGPKPPIKDQTSTERNDNDRGAVFAAWHLPSWQFLLACPPSIELALLLVAKQPKKVGCTRHQNRPTSPFLDVWLEPGWAGGLSECSLRHLFRR